MTFSYFSVLRNFLVVEVVDCRRPSLSVGLAKDNFLSHNRRVCICSLFRFMIATMAHSNAKALRHPDIRFLRCYAHQVNLMINAPLKLPLFEDWAKKAAAAAKAIAASSSKWLQRLGQRLWNLCY
jgi:hypothetical protein